MMPEPLPTPPPSAQTLPDQALAEIRQRADSVWTRSGEAPAVHVKRLALSGPRGRVAIIDGCRTPFAKAGTELRDMDVVDLAGVAAAELVARCGIDPQEIERSIFGAVV